MDKNLTDSRQLIHSAYRTLSRLSTKRRQKCTETHDSNWTSCFFILFIDFSRLFSVQQAEVCDSGELTDKYSAVLSIKNSCIMYNQNHFVPYRAKIIVYLFVHVCTRE